MRVVLLFFLLSLLLFPAAYAESIKIPGQTWIEHPKEKFPEAIYQEFLKLPKTSTGHIQAILNRKNVREQPVLVFVDIRSDIAVFFFRGVPGGRGFALSEDIIYSDRTYILEVRWKDTKTGHWQAWWNRNKLDGSFLLRPELWPLAGNAPF